jgi:hypothetical protein
MALADVIMFFIKNVDHKTTGQPTIVPYHDADGTYNTCTSWTRTILSSSWAFGSRLLASYEMWRGVKEINNLL